MRIIKRLFPKIKKEFPLEQQLSYVISEVREARKAIGDREHFLEEMIDVIHCSFNTLYLQYSDREIAEMIVRVAKKNRDRGYY
jgi:hypothetical protein